MIISRMEIPEKISEQVKKMADQGEDQEHLIAFMRSAGLPKPHSIRLLSTASHISLGDAKEAVHYSPTWQDRRASDEAFHETAIQAMEELQREDERNPERLAS